MEEKKGLIKTKKQMFIVIGVFTLVMLLGTVTYAFFNYTRTGSQNIIKTGRIYFNSEQGTAINLTNMFPIDTTETGVMDDATKVGTVTINVVGDTTYSGGIEYLVSAVNVQNTTGNKSLPISIQVSVEDNNENDPSTSLGTSDTDYFTNRGTSAQTSIYKVLASDVIENNQDLVVGYIKSGQDGVDGNIVIKAYIDKNNVAISDTYPEETKREVVENYSTSACETALTGAENVTPSTVCANAEALESALGSLTNEQLTALVTAGVLREYTNGTPASFGEGRTVLTATEWNSLQTNGVSFQVKVEANEGVWAENPNTLYNAVKAMSRGTMNSGTDFGTVASSDTTNHPYGVYQLVESNLESPIYFFRGDHTVKNNVIFDNKCWLVVRTTETNSTRILYNGTPVNGECTTTTGNDTMISLYQSDSVNSDGNYDYSYTTREGYTRLKSGASFNYNVNKNDAKYVGYTYDNGVSSNMKNALEAWYEGAISNEAKAKIETSTYCNDTTVDVDESDTSYTRYMPYTRASANTPSVVCPTGTNVINSKVGFLTVDDVILAGRTFSSGMQDYLYNNSYWWLGSPYNFRNVNSSVASVFRTESAFSVSFGSYVHGDSGLRPVVSILSNAEITGGDGSQGSPWLIG